MGKRSIPIETDEKTGRRFKRQKNGQRVFLCEHDAAPTKCLKGECKKRFKNRSSEPCPCGKGLQLKMCRLCDTPGAGAAYCSTTKKAKARCPCPAPSCGGSRCRHKKLRNRCRECEPVKHLIHLVRSRSRKVMKGLKSKRTIEYLGMNAEEYRDYIERRFQPGMTWENFGTGPDQWSIGHAKPLLEKGVSTEETERRLRYSNTFPQWHTDNAAQGNRFHFTAYGPLAD
jgi:hypothetical protein